MVLVVAVLYREYVVDDTHTHTHSLAIHIRYYSFLLEYDLYVERILMTRTQNFTRSGCSNEILRVTPLWVARYGMVSALASHPTNRCPFGPHVVLLATCYDNSMPDMT